MTEFRHIGAEDLEYFSGDSLEYLNSAAKSIGNYHGIAQAFAQVQQGTGHIYQVMDGKELMGCFFINFVHNHLGHVMNLILLGGKQIAAWGPDLTKFLWQQADEHKVDEFCYLGREGFKKIFPHLEKVAVLYRVKR